MNPCVLTRQPRVRHPDKHQTGMIATLTVLVLLILAALVALAAREVAMAGWLAATAA